METFSALLALCAGNSPVYVSSSFLAWSSIAQSVCQQVFSLLANRYLRPWVRILHSAEEDNLSPFDSNIGCLCQSMYVCMYVCMYFRQRAFSLLAIWCLRPWWVRILHSAEEDNLSPFDSNIACLCQSIEINNDKHIYISPEPGAKVNWQWGQVGWMLADHRDGLSSSSF